MEKHPSNAVVQHHACGALFNTCWTTQAHWKIAKEHNAKALLEKADTKKAKESLEKMGLYVK